VIIVLCPWHGEHRFGGVTAAYHPEESGQRAGFKCFHTACANRTIDDFTKWAAENGRPVAVKEVQ
jgi:hypothetical protein